MQNFNALCRAGPFEVDRWMQKHELNIKGSIKMLDSQSFGGCKGGINQFLCQAGGASPAVLVVSRQTKTASQTPDSGPALRKCLLFLKKHSSQTPRGLKCMQTTDLTFNERTCTALWRDGDARCMRSEIRNGEDYHSNISHGLLSWTIIWRINFIYAKASMHAAQCPNHAVSRTTMTLTINRLTTKPTKITWVQSSSGLNHVLTPKFQTRDINCTV